jgi:hypothetical protein
MDRQAGDQATSLYQTEANQILAVAPATNLKALDFDASRARNRQ